MRKFYKFCLLFSFLFFGVYLFAQSPGGISTNLKLWLKAENYNVGTTTWNDLSPSNLDFIVDGTLATPGRIDNFINFNPVASFIDPNHNTIIALRTAVNPVFATGTNIRNSIVVASSTLQNSSFKAVFSYGTGTATAVGRAFNNGAQGTSAALSIKPNNTGGGPMVSSMTLPNVYTVANTGFNIVTAGVNSIGDLLLQANAGPVSTQTSGVPFDTTNSIAHLGTGGGGGANNRIPWKGYLAEVIFYDDDLTATPSTINRIYSYLALKYGTSLLNGAGFNYLNSDGTTIWSEVGNAGYNNDVFGIGRDVASGLNQQISKSTGDDFLILSTDTNFTNANGSHAAIATDKSYIITGHNNLSEDSFLPFLTGSSVNQILTRIWKINTSGPSMGVVNVKPNDPSVTHMLVSTDPTFASGVTEVPLASQVASYNFGSGTTLYISFGKLVNAPGGVYSSSSSMNGVSFKVYNGYDSTPENGFDTSTLIQKGVTNNFYDLDRYLTNIQRDGYTISAKSNLTISSTDDYYFRFESLDQDMALFIDGVMVFSGNCCSDRTTPTPINLMAGIHEIELVFSEDTGSSNMKLSWSTDNVTYTPIPDNLLTINAGSAEILNWYRSDMGIANADGATLTSWQDQSGFDSDLVTITGTPTVYKTTANQLFNFNPSVYFEYDNAVTSGYSKNVLLNENPRTSFSVTSKTNSAYQYIAGIGGGNSLGSNYFYGFGSDFYRQNIKHFNQNSLSGNSDYQYNNAYLSTVEILNPKITPTNNLEGFVNNDSNLSNSISSTATSLSDVGYFSIGDIPTGGSTGFIGNIMEVFHYPFILNNSELNRVHSYLGLKYGVSLSEGIGANYTASNGSTIFWDPVTNNGFNFGIFGIGRDDVSMLEQQISTSSRNKSILTLSTDNNFVLPNKSHTTIPNNLSFFMVGNNGLGIDYDDYILNPAIDKIMKRKWKVQETGVNIANINININDPNVTHLLVSSLENFSTLDAIIPLTTKSATYDFNDGEFFTFGFDSSGATTPNICPDPGNLACETDVVIWLKDEPYDATKIFDQMFLQIESFTKGLALTQVVNPEIDIEFPYPGMLVFDETEDCLKIYRNASWSGCIFLDQN